MCVLEGWSRNGYDQRGAVPAPAHAVAQQLEGSLPNLAHYHLITGARQEKPDKWNADAVVVNAGESDDDAAFARTSTAQLYLFGCSRQYYTACVT